jgi:hypothetical protein
MKNVPKASLREKVKNEKSLADFADFAECKYLLDQ